MFGASAPGSSSSRVISSPYLQARLGPEPLGPLSAPRLGERLEGRRAPLKSALLDQRTIAGLGNIYVDEALWQSRLHPLRVAGQPRRRPSSHACIARSAASCAKASSARARRSATTRCPTGAYGSMQDEFRAYGRGGEPCERCGTPPCPHRRRRPHDDVLPALPDSERELHGVERSTTTTFLTGDAAAERASGREALGQKARAVERGELVVAADRLVVDRHERHRPPATQVVDALAEARIVVERRLSSYASPRASSRAFARTQ